MRRFQLFLFEGRRFFVPFPFLWRPRAFFPAEVRPRNSRCFLLDWVIQRMLGSLRMTLWLGSTRITSKYLYKESWFTQYELSTRREPKAFPALDSAKVRKFLPALIPETPWFLGFPLTRPLGKFLLRPPLRTRTR